VISSVPEFKNNPSATNNRNGDDISFYLMRLLCNDFEGAHTNTNLGRSECCRIHTGVNTILGDHLEASSAADVSFWPIHPTLERLLHYKMYTTSDHSSTA
jgi:hypothetical protein